MKYQGMKDICIEIADDVMIRFNLGLTTRGANYWFLPDNVSFSTATEDNILLKRFDHDTQGKLIY